MRNDAGMVTLESALAAAALLLFTSALIGVLSTFGSLILAVDLAGAAARSHAIGVAYTPPRGSVDIEESSTHVTATAYVPAPFGDMRAQAVYPKETS